MISYSATFQVHHSGDEEDEESAATAATAAAAPAAAAESGGDGAGPPAAGGAVDAWMNTLACKILCLRDSSGILTYTLYWYISSYTRLRGSYTMLVYNSG